MPPTSFDNLDKSIQLINTWRKPLRVEDQVSQNVFDKVEKKLGFTLPTALREWHQIAGSKIQIGNSDYLVPINELKISKNHLIICIENQAVVFWGIPLDQLSNPDPPIYVDDGTFENKDTNTKWQVSSTSFSSFILYMIIHEILLSSQYTGQGWISPNEFEAIKNYYSEISTSKNTQFPTIFYEDQDTLIAYDENPSKNNKHYLLFATNTKKSLDKLIKLTENIWEEIRHDCLTCRHPVNNKCRDIPNYNLLTLEDEFFKSNFYPECHP